MRGSPPPANRAALRRTAEQAYIDGPRYLTEPPYYWLIEDGTPRWCDWCNRQVRTSADLLGRRLAECECTVLVTARTEP
jgi:hypothetical protein